jgi:hypothetical protein
MLIIDHLRLNDLVVMVEIFIIQAILTTRLCAMYKGHDWILRCLLALYVASMVATVIPLVLATARAPGNYMTSLDPCPRC